MAAAAMQRGFSGPGGVLKRDTGDMMRSGEYYVTPEVCNHLYQIQDAVDNIRFDQQLLGSSDAWQGHFDQHALSSEMTGAVSAVARSTDRMTEVKKNMVGRKVANLQDNQVRQLHHWATSTLGTIQQDIGPYAEQSRDRIRQFCDEVGATDRYTGYRNNMTRGSRDPVRLGYQWLDPTPNALNRSSNTAWRPSSTPPTYQGTPAPVSAPPSYSFTTKQTTGTVPSLHVVHSGNTMSKPVSTASIQEQCGINTRFPGTTEYMTRYQKPPLDRPTRAFTINPTPNFGIYGRPLMRNEFSPNNTEYQARYQFPDGNRITKLPWLKN